MRRHRSDLETPADSNLLLCMLVRTIRTVNTRAYRGDILVDIKLAVVADILAPGEAGAASLVRGPCKYSVQHQNLSATYYIDERRKHIQIQPIQSDDDHQYGAVNCRWTYVRRDKPDLHVRLTCLHDRLKDAPSRTPCLKTIGEAPSPNSPADHAYQRPRSG